MSLERKKRREREKKQQSRPEGGLWLQRAKAHKRTSFCVCVSQCPHDAQVRVRQRALF